MQIQLTEEDSNVAGFISWKRLAKLLIRAGELSSGEHITRMNISENGINYFVLRETKSSAVR